MHKSSLRYLSSKLKSSAHRKCGSSGWLRKLKVRLGGKNARVPMGSNYKPRVQVSIGTTRAFLEISFSLQTGFVHICVSAVPVFFLSNFLYPTGFNRAFSPFLLSIIPAWSHKQQNIAPIITSIQTDAFAQSPAETEWKCLSRRWAIVKVSSLQNRRPITQPDNIIHTVSNKSFQHRC